MKVMIFGMTLAALIFIMGIGILISAVVESVKQSKKEKEKERRKEDGKKTK